MNSSTFSSSDEWKVVLFVTVVLCACELGIRFLSQMSVDLQHRNEIPQLARALRNAPSPRVLFLGNSLTKRGISLDSFREQLEQEGCRVGGVCKAHPDSTSLREWYFVFAGHFARADTTGSPDCVIVTFVHDHLADQCEVRLRRMALNIADRRQILEVFCHDIRSIDDGVFFLAAHFLASVGYQPAAKHRILSSIIPHYATETQRLNQVRRAYLKADVQQELPAEQASFTYTKLQRFIDVLDQQGSLGVFCMMPLPGEQFLDVKLVETVKSNNMIFLDFRELASLTRGHYPDGYHMDPVAADIYSRAVASALAERHLDMFIARPSRLPSGHNELVSPETPINMQKAP